jgi:hypothetical protein
MMINRRFDALLLLLCSISIALGTSFSGADEDEPYDPTSPEHVAEREDDDSDEVDPEEGLLSGPAVEPQTSPRRGGGQGQGGGGGMGQMNAMSIFTAKCQQCHGPQKQKGGVQLLPMDMIFSGSEEYWYVQKGDPGASELMRRITLPAEHDDVMPPDGDLLSAAEIKVIEDWIRSGASTDIKQPERGQRRVRPRQWAQVFLGLELKSEQRTEAEAVLASYQRENAEFDREHQVRIRELEQQMRETRDSNDTIANASMKQELDKLRAQRPKFESVQESLWEMLTADQQDAMRDALTAASTRTGMGNDGGRGRSGAAGRPGNSNSALTEDERRRLRELMRERRRNGQGRSPRGSDDRGDDG